MRQSGDTAPAGAKSRSPPVRCAPSHSGLGQPSAPSSRPTVTAHGGHGNRLRARAGVPGTIKQPQAYFRVKLRRRTRKRPERVPERS